MPFGWSQKTKYFDLFNRLFADSNQMNTTQGDNISLLDVSFRTQPSQKPRQAVSPARQQLLSKVNVQGSRQYTTTGKRPEIQIIEKQKQTKKVLVVEEFDAKDYVIPGVSETEIEVYKEIFDLFSISGTGMLTPLDLRNAMESIGYHPKKNVVYQIVSEVDSDESGGIDFKEFLEIVTGQTQNFTRNDTGKLREVFRQFDQNNKGFCSKKEFAMASKELGEDVSIEKIDKIFMLLSPKEPEKLSFDAFCKFIKNWKPA